MEKGDPTYYITSFKLLRPVAGLQVLDCVGKATRWIKQWLLNNIVARPYTVLVAELWL